MGNHLTAATAQGMSFYKRVNNIALTKKERMVAQYLLDNITKSGFMTASGISRELGISDVTVIRFARKLGYDGFAELQETLQKDIVDKLESGSSFTIPVERLSSSIAETGQESMVALALEAMRANLETLTTKNTDAVFATAARLIYESKRKFVMGLRGSSSLAEAFSLRLSYLLDDVFRITRADPNDYGSIYTMQKGDCLVAYGYDNYPQATVSAVQHAKKKGATVISMTDKETSPIAFRTDVAIYCSIEGVGFNSFAGVMLANEILAAHLVRLVGKDMELRNHDLLAQLSESGFFWNRQ